METSMQLTAEHRSLPIPGRGVLQRHGIRNKVLNEKALDRAEVLRLIFKGSVPQNVASGWKMRRNVGIRRGTNTVQKIPDDYKEKLLHFRRSIIRHRELHSYGN